MSAHEVNEWYISAAGYGDGKSVCLWVKIGVISRKIARFQNVEAAKIFTKSFNFPLSKRVENVLIAAAKEVQP